MVDYFFHNVPFLFVQIILLEEYEESSANIVPLQEYNFNRGCEKSGFLPASVEREIVFSNKGNSAIM
jgi:hypothetical protein